MALLSSIWFNALSTVRINMMSLSTAVILNLITTTIMSRV